MKVCVSFFPRGMKRRPEAFALVELLLAVCCVALVVTPFVVYLRGASLLQGRSSVRGRELAQNAYQRNVLMQGIDPLQASHFSGAHPVTGRGVQAGILRDEPVSLDGAVALVPLRNALLETGIDTQVVAVGLELGAVEPLPPLDPVQEPVLPVTMRPPIFSPANGSLLQARHFSHGSVPLAVSSTEAGRVVLELRRPALWRSGVLRVEAALGAAELLAGLEGDAWVEFPGSESRHQRPVELPDGRLSWYVEGAEGVRRYLPSARVPLRYRVYLGAPVLVLGEGMHQAGEVVAVDFRRVAAVRAGDSPVRIQWPDTLSAALGSGAGLAGSFLVSFEGVPCDNSSLGAGLFGPGLLSRWGQRSVLQAQPLLPPGGVGRASSWQLVRTPLPLPQPLRVFRDGESADLPVSPGRVEFRVAEMPGLGSVGRLSARGGTILGPGGVLQLEVSP